MEQLSNQYTKEISTVIGPGTEEHLEEPTLPVEPIETPEKYKYKHIERIPSQLREGPRPEFKVRWMTPEEIKKRGPVEEPKLAPKGLTPEERKRLVPAFGLPTEEVPENVEKLSPKRKELSKTLPEPTEEKVTTSEPTILEPKKLKPTKTTVPGKAPAFTKETLTDLIHAYFIGYHPDVVSAIREPNAKTYLVKQVWQDPYWQQEIGKQIGLQGDEAAIGDQFREFMESTWGTETPGSKDYGKLASKFSIPLRHL